MNTRNCRISLVTALVIVSLGGRAAMEASVAQEVGDALKGAWDVGGKVIDKIKRDPDVPNFEVDGKFFWICRIIGGRESRATLNITRGWDGRRTFKVYFLNVPDDLRSVMAVQRKYDNTMGKDPDRDSAIRDGGSTEPLKEIHHDYFAARNFDPTQVVKDNPTAAILIVEDGLPLEKVSQYIKDHAGK